MNQKGQGLPWWLVSLLVAIVGLVFITIWQTGSFGSLTDLFKRIIPTNETNESANLNRYRMACSNYVAKGCPEPAPKAKNYGLEKGSTSCEKLGYSC